MWLAASFIIAPFFATAGPVINSMTAVRLESVLRYFVIPELLQRGILDARIFVQDKASPQIGTLAQLLKQYFIVE